MKYTVTSIGIALLSLINNVVFAQTYQAGLYVKIPQNTEIVKIVNAKNCPETVVAGSVVKTTYNKNNGDVKFTISKTDSNDSDIIMPFDKVVKVTYSSLPGKANITVDKDDNSILHLNYWLSKTEVPKGYLIVINEYSFDCNGVKRLDKTYRKRIAKDSLIYLEKIDPTGITSEWYLKSNVIIEVYDKKNNLKYYLINKYDRNGDYQISLNNRQFLSYKSRSFDFGPVTVPFKFRPGFTINRESKKVEVNDEFSADLNLGIYAGYRKSFYRVRYETDKIVELSNIGYSFGGFVSFSAMKIDSLSTTTAEVPLRKDDNMSIGVVSPGLGLLFTLYNFQIGAFIGIDVGVGQYGYKWNYNGKPWIGFGLTYNLESFWKK